jgi:hypothetical protein
MAIRINYAPVGAIAQSAYLGGLGQYQQRQADQQLRVMQLKQQERQFQQNLAAQFARSREAEMADLRRMAVGAGITERRDKMLAGERAKEAVESRDFSSAEAMRDRDWRTGEAAAGRDFSSAEADRRAKMAWDTSAAISMEEDAVEEFESLVEDSDMNPFAATTYADLAGKLRAIRKTKTEVRPEQYGKALGQWLEEVESSGIKRRVKPKPTLEEEITGSVYWAEDPNVPGRKLPMAKDRNGTPHVVPGYSLPDPEEGGGPVRFSDQWKTPADYQKDFEATRKRIIDEQTAADQKKHSAAIKAGKTPPASVEPAPSTEEVQERMRKDKLAFEAFRDHNAALDAAMEPEGEPPVAGVDARDSLSQDSDPRDLELAGIAAAAFGGGSAEGFVKGVSDARERARKLLASGKTADQILKENYAESKPYVREIMEKILQQEVGGPARDSLSKTPEGPPEGGEKTVGAKTGTVAPAVALAVLTDDQIAGFEPIFNPTNSTSMTAFTQQAAEELQALGELTQQDAAAFKKVAEVFQRLPAEFVLEDTEESWNKFLVLSKMTDKEGKMLDRVLHHGSKIRPATDKPLKDAGSDPVLMRAYMREAEMINAQYVDDPEGMPDFVQRRLAQIDAAMGLTTE